MCRFMESLEANSVPNIYLKPEAPFQSKSNIFYFLTAAEQLGVQRHRLFKTSDLIDKNRRQFLKVVETLEEMSIFSEVPLSNLNMKDIPDWTDDELAEAEKEVMHVKVWHPRTVNRIKRSSSEVRKSMMVLSPSSLAVVVANIIKGKEHKVIRGVVLMQACVRGRIARRKYQTRLTENAKRKSVAKVKKNDNKRGILGKGFDCDVKR